MKITVLAADPKFSRFGDVKHIAEDTRNLDVRVLFGVSHTIWAERPEAILDVIPLPRAKL